MRTKTLILSSLIGAFTSIVAFAQSSNVYSLNAAGYVATTLPAGCYVILTCNLIGSPDNTLNTVLPNTNGQYKKAKVFAFAGGNYTTTETGVATTVDPSGWVGGGADISLTPGSAVFFYNSTTTAMTATFVGIVPQGSLTNSLIPGYNMVGSMVPTFGDLSTNPIMQLTNIFKKDYIYTYDPTNGYSAKDAVVAPGVGSGFNNQYLNGDPIITQTGYGFFYFNSQSTNNPWVENFTINP